MKTLLLRLRLALFAPLMLAAAACHSGSRVVPPDGFAEMDSGESYSYRATNASGVVIAVRTEDNNPKGNLDFWTAALDYKLQKSGYSKLEEAPEKVTTEAGVVGQRLRYEVSRGGRPHEYWVTVFVTSSRVIVVEAAGDKAFFNGETQKRIATAVQSVDFG